MVTLKRSLKLQCKKYLKSCKQYFNNPKPLHSMHWGIIPPQKHHPPLYCQAPLKLTNCPSAPFLGNHPLYIGFLWTPLKVWSIIEPQKYYSFSSLIPSYLLKVTKSLGKLSQFEFLVMTEKIFLLINFFCH